MNKKIFLPLLAVAALGASCTNEIDEFAQQTANGKGYKVNLKVANDVANTRIAWDGETAVAWENFDQFSVYNIHPTADYADRFKASSNAAYKTVDGGQNFTSENVLFTGAHVLVYPLNKKFITPNADITVATGTDGDKGLGANSIFLSKQLLNITEAGQVTADGITYNDAGYQKNIQVSVRPANAGLFLNLKEAGNNFNLAEGDDPVQIKKVEVIHEGGSVVPFASSAVLARNTEYNVITRANGLTNTIFTEYNVNKPVLTTEGVTSTIAILPNEAYTDVDASTSKIIVYTNYGYVTINKAGMVTSVKDGKEMAQLGTGRAEKTKDNENLNLSFNDEFTTLATRAVAGTKMPNIKRDVVVDMTTANIDGLQIYNSTDLKNAYRAFDLMNKDKGEVTFQLIPTDHKFTLTKEAIEIINNHKAADKYATLDITGITEFTLSGFGTEEYTEVPVIDQITAPNVVLSADNKWKIDVANAAGANQFGNINNKGELQLTQGTATVALVTPITNDGTLTFGSNEVTVPVYVAQNGSMEIAEGQSVKMASAEFNDKSNTVVKGEMISYPEIHIYSGAIVDVYGNLLNTTGNTLDNAGTINIKDGDKAQVIISANEIAPNKGTVYVTAKDNNLNTGSAAGYVKLPVSDEEFVMNKENMGIANYIEFSGSKLNMDIQWWNAYVELKSNVKVTAKAAKVGLFVVNKDVQVTVADGSAIETKVIDNKGKIYNYGTFTYTTGDKGTIYDL